MISCNIHEIEQDGDHRWAVVHYSCSLNDENDELIQAMIAMVREVYGERKILAEAQTAALQEPDPLVTKTFDLQAIQRAFRSGLPDPAVEKNKPPHLSNYRSETAEMLARAALEAAYGVSLPVAPQLGKTNPNQPVLGFDGWGLLEIGTGEWALVLIQVKGTEEARRPPGVARRLITECGQAPHQLAAIARALSVLVVLLTGSPLQPAILAMLERLGRGRPPALIIAPAIVRGKTAAHRDDLKSLRSAARNFKPALARGVSLSIGVDLTDFGRLVMAKARKTA